jgi:hypothetical protein
VEFEAGYHFDRLGLTPGELVVAPETHVPASVVLERGHVAHARNRNAGVGQRATNRRSRPALLEAIKANAGAELLAVLPIRFVAGQRGSDPNQQHQRRDPGELRPGVRFPVGHDAGHDMGVDGTETRLESLVHGTCRGGPDAA